MRILFLLVFSCLLRPALYSQPVQQKQLLALLGKMPPYPALKVDTLENKVLPEGMRYKIRFLVEDSGSFFHTPPDYIYAYVFVPRHSPGSRLPGIVAIHQDGNHDGLGKEEPAGLAGDKDQHYASELFEKGYIVICPDRYYHGQRRRIPVADSTKDSESDRWAQQWIGQLLLQGRTSAGKEVYDLKRTVDVLCHTPGIDTARIGAIGHLSLIHI